MSFHMNPLLSQILRGGATNAEAVGSKRKKEKKRGSRREKPSRKKDLQITSLEKGGKLGKS